MTPDYDIAKFKAALAEESDFPLTDALFEMILNHSDTLRYDKGVAIVDFDRCNPDIYFIADGIVRGYMLSEGIENNIYFGLEGTMVSSMQSFSLGEKPIIRIEACCPTTVLRMRKGEVDRLMSESNDFCRWMGGIFMRRSCYDEVKAKMMNGDARWRYEWLERCRPELFEHVPLKAIASYLKMTEVHVSRIRKMINKGIKPG